MCISRMIQESSRAEQLDATVKDSSSAIKTRVCPNEAAAVSDRYSLGMGFEGGQWVIAAKTKPIQPESEWMNIRR